MEALNLTNNKSTQVFLKKFCLDINCWLLNIKILRTTFFQSTPQQLKAAKNSTKYESKNENIKQKKNKKHSNSIKSAQEFFWWIFYILFQRLKICFARIHLAYWDYVVCYMPFGFKSYCLFWVTCSNFFFSRFCTFNFGDEVVNMNELFISESINL